MSFTRVQSAKGTKSYTTDTTVSATLTGVTSGNNIIVIASTGVGIGTLTVSDDKSNSYSSQSSSTATYQRGISTIAVASGVTSGDTIITATRTDASSADIWVLAIEYNISDGVAVFQDSSYGNGYATSGDSGNATATETALIIGSTVNESQVPTVSGSWTTVDSFSNFYKYYGLEQIGVASGSYNVATSWTGNDSWTDMIAVIQSDGSGGGGSTDGAAMYYYMLNQG